jgi:carbonic anhydrase
MSIIDGAVKSNRNYSKRHDPKLAQPPAPKLAVVTCMDPRLSNLPEILGIPHVDIDVIRTGGPALTDDVLGELVVSTRVLGTTEILLLNHTGCGFTTFTDDELNVRLAASTGDSSPVPMCFDRDLEAVFLENLVYAFPASAIHKTAMDQHHRCCLRCRHDFLLFVMGC